MHSIVSSRARHGAAAAMILAAITLLSGCATDIDPLIAPDSADEAAEPSASPSSNASEYAPIVAGFVTETAALQNNFHNAVINMEDLTEQGGGECIEELYQVVLGFNNDFQVVANNVTTLQNQIAAGENVDPEMIKSVQVGIATGKQNDATAKEDLLTECR